MTKRKWNNEQLKELCKNSISYSQVLKGLGLVCKGGNFRTIKKKIKELNIDISHFLGRGWLKDKKHNFTPAKSLKEILIEVIHYKSNTLKQRLLNVGIFERKCYNCNNTEWMGNPISLELEHKNGNHFDNRLENLTVLCPNCHSYTPTYRGKNKIRYAHVVEQADTKLLKSFTESSRCADSNSAVGTIKTKKEKKRNFCIDCKKQISLYTTRCKSCAGKINSPAKIVWPEKEELEKLIWKISTVQLSKQLGVSDKAIEKKCKKFGISKPPRGYWMKQK